MDEAGHKSGDGQSNIASAQYKTGDQSKSHLIFVQGQLGFCSDAKSQSLSDNAVRPDKPDIPKLRLFLTEENNQTPLDPNRLPNTHHEAAQPNSNPEPPTSRDSTPPSLPSVPSGRPATGPAITHSLRVATRSPRRPRRRSARTRGYTPKSRVR